MNFINTERFRIFIQKFIHILLRSKFNKNFNRLLIFSNNYFSFLLINLIKYSDSRKLYSF